ncbi:MAG: dipicolinate synthase subunit B, partial [Halanaerobium sp.]|nr:dipicolinate synthase subunit B [Halanaerobium sp.]
SHCTLEQIIPELQKLVDTGAEVIPVFSERVKNTDTKFGPARKWMDQVVEITGKEPLSSIVEVEPFGPGRLLDILLVAPCTGNTIAKLANGIIDATVPMACKAQLRNGRPVVLAIATNDGLGLNAINIGLLLNARDLFFVPFGQDNPAKKKNSLVARMELIIPTLAAALEGEQLQPVLIEYRGI